MNLATLVKMLRGDNQPAQSQVVGAGMGLGDVKPASEGNEFATGAKVLTNPKLRPRWIDYRTNTTDDPPLGFEEWAAAQEGS